MYTLTSIIQKKTVVVCSYSLALQVIILSYRFQTMVDRFTRALTSPPPLEISVTLFIGINPTDILGHPHIVKVIFCIKFPKKATAWTYEHQITKASKAPCIINKLHYENRGSSTTSHVNTVLYVSHSYSMLTINARFKQTFLNEILLLECNVSYFHYTLHIKMTT